MKSELFGVNSEICEVCGHSNLIPVLNLGKHPLCDDLIPIGNTAECSEYPIEIIYCDECYTAFQKYQVEKKLLFPKSYHYRARMTGSVLNGMKDFVESAEIRLDSLSGKLVLDIGCNDGSLLDFFKLKGCKTVGIEPTDAAQDSQHPTINSFFDNDSATQFLNEYGQPDIITFTNVFAHISNLPELLSNLKKIMGQDTVLIVENHYLGAVFRTDQFDTFYHEHPRTYSHRSFECIAKSLGINLFDTQYVSRYGGNIRVFMGRREPEPSSKDEENVFLEQFTNMNINIKEWQKEVKTWILNYLSDHGKIRAKAFPGRAAILIKLLDLNENHISAVYEITGSIKVGHYVPGTRIPILPEAELYSLENQSETILNLAWHLPNEVRDNLKKNGYQGQVHDIKIFQGEGQLKNNKEIF